MTDLERIDQRIAELSALADRRYSERDWLSCDLARMALRVAIAQREELL